MRPSHFQIRRAVITEQECRDSMRCGLSDRTGTLRFDTLDIVASPDCIEIATALRGYLVGRALAEADAAHIRQLGGMTHPLCAGVVAGLVQRAQSTFLHNRKSTSIAPR